MKKIIIQKFNPPIHINTGGKSVKINERYWDLSKNGIVEGGIQEMGYMGQYQILKIWKHYAEDIYISNMGYVAKIDNAVIKNEFANLLEKFKNEGVSYFDDLTVKQKEIIQECNIVPENQKRKGFQIWLGVKVGNKIKTLHTMVAEKFLIKPDDGWGVHHIDNNSYNNSVANLAWVTQEEHNSKLHPMSGKGKRAE